MFLSLLKQWALSMYEACGGSRIFLRTSTNSQSGCANLLSCKFFAELSLCIERGETRKRAQLSNNRSGNRDYAPHILTYIPEERLKQEKIYSWTSLERPISLYLMIRVDIFRWPLKRGFTVQNLDVSLDALKEEPASPGPEPHKPGGAQEVKL